MSLQYLLKCLCSKIAMLRGYVEPNCHAKLSHSRQILENIHPMVLAQFHSLTEKIFTVATPKRPRITTVCNCSTRKERRRDKIRLRTRSTFRQSLMVSGPSSIWVCSVCHSGILAYLDKDQWRSRNVVRRFALDQLCVVFRGRDFVYCYEPIRGMVDDLDRVKIMHGAKLGLF